MTLDWQLFALLITAPKTLTSNSAKLDNIALNLTLWNLLSLPLSIQQLVK